jgi:hypothetical protein
MEVPGMLWGVCLLNASNGASFIGTASAATSSFYTDSEEYSKWLQELHAEAYAAAFSQLQQAENYCLRDKVAFLVRSGAMNGPVVADSIGKEPVEAAEGVTHLAARAEVSTEELKAEVLAEDFLKQKEL